MKKLKAATIRELAQAVVDQDRERQLSRQRLLWIFQRIACDPRSDGFVPGFIQELIDKKEKED